METQNLIVARYLDGRMLKGVTHDFSPNRGFLHVDRLDGGPGVELRFKELKALFFVRSLEGDPAHQDVQGFVHGPAETQQGKKIAVRFRDGEFICGYTLSWTPEREGFFMFPADPESNNVRIYVITASTEAIKAGPAAETLAQRHLTGGAGSAAPPPSSRGVWRPNPAGTPPAANPRPSASAPRPPLGGGIERRTGTD